jgi:hypothetical protein
MHSHRNARPLGADLRMLRIVSIRPLLALDTEAR